MNPININIAKPSHTAAANPLASNASPAPANPIVPQAGSLAHQQESEKQERSIQFSSPQTSPRASEEKLLEDPATRLRNALTIQNPAERDAVLLEIAKDSNTPAIERETAIQALSAPEKGDETRIAIATNPELDAYYRLDAAQHISAANIAIKDEILLEIAKDGNIFYNNCWRAAEALSTQEKRDEAWIAIATNPNIYLGNRIEAAINISQANSSIKDALLLETTKDADTLLIGDSRPVSISDNLIMEAIYLLSTKEKRDEACMARATNRNIYLGDRIEAAISMSDANNAIKDELLLEFLKDMNLSFWNRDDAIRALSTQKKRDEACIAMATNENLEVGDRIYYAQKISAADNTILRDKVLIELYNEALNQGQEGEQLEAIIDAIQDPDLQALARDALAAGGPVRLGSTKSARNVQE